MSTLKVTEYATLARDGQNWIMPVAQEPAIAIQSVSFTTHAESSAFNAQTRFVRVQADADCCILFGASPTATTSHTPLTAGQPEVFGVTPGHKVSAVAAA